MQAYKLKGTIDESGRLIITEPVHLAPGEVEVIILQSVPVAKSSASKTETSAELSKRERPSKIKALQDWFAKTEPAPPDFDADQARWEALQEKHNL